MYLLSQDGGNIKEKACEGSFSREFALSVAEAGRSHYSCTDCL